ncbi:hypothetical protein Hrd1104_10970 [Halorhabdus sp. CBA1104]|uniref:hypothetical protein n=1 Tax=unclassified Halorhabdus TaxID=2621901 RepID=UPI0012B19E58|nr:MULTISPECIES: hypothetical protein [unclassified Halorhabdus]QGN07767.1 hypothetical protein Hrd1104_10970 [Halorhabdus sp. CBA1104]
MSEPNFVQLTTLWFVILVFIQTNPGNADGALITAVGILAILLMYFLPVLILSALLARFIESE